MTKAIVIGATSGIGRQLAINLAREGYVTGVTGRREHLLASLKATYPDKYITAAFDSTAIDDVPVQLNKLVQQLGGLDLLIISSGRGEVNPDLDFEIEKAIADLNVVGFTVVADWAFNYFQQQGYGHLTAITSVAGIRGNRQAPAYFASKAYQINYLQALTQKAAKLKLPIYITDARPGFVDTAMAQGDGLFWVATVEKAADQILDAIKSKKKVVYVSKRWRIIALLTRLLPKSLYNKL